MGCANSRLPNDEETGRNPSSSIPSRRVVLRRGRREVPLTPTQRLMLEDPLYNFPDHSPPPEPRQGLSSERQEGRRIIRRTRQYLRNNRSNGTRGSRDDSPFSLGEMVFARNNNTNGGDGLDLDDDLSRLRGELVMFERLFETLIQQHLDPGGSAVPSSSCPPASVSALERLPLMKIKECDFEDDSKKECCICFLEFSVDDEVSRLPCGHIFHKKCVAEWLRKKCTCPECRWELETEDERFEVERRERMKSRKIKVKDHELDRLCIEALQDMAGTREVTSRHTLIETIKSLDHVDVVTKKEDISNPKDEIIPI